MSKTTKNDVVETVDTSIETSEPIVDNELKAYLVKKEDGYHIEDLDGNLSDVLAVHKSGALTLTPNAANRQWFMLKKADAIIAENGEDYKIPLTFKATRTIDGTSRSNKLPNEKLIAYLPEAEQEEYRAIIARAIAARDADREANKKKPMTEVEKARAKMVKIMQSLKDAGMSEEDIRALIEKNSDTTTDTTEGGNN
jgi:hypothetical protein